VLALFHSVHKQRMACLTTRRRSGKANRYAEKNHETGDGYLWDVALCGGDVLATPAHATVFTIGGAIYTDLANPLTSGKPGVTITVTGDGGTFTATTPARRGSGPLRTFRRATTR